MPEYLQSPKLRKVLTELYYLQFLRSFFNSIYLQYQHTSLTTSRLGPKSAETFVPRKPAKFRLELH